MVSLWAGETPRAATYDPCAKSLHFGGFFPIWYLRVWYLLFDDLLFAISEFGICYLHVSNSELDNLNLSATLKP
jgi:hypothetical protein